MSEFLAEAAVRIIPDTTRFRTELLAQLTAATRGITATIPIAATIGPALATQSGEIRAAVQQLEAVAAQQVVGTATATRAATATRSLSREQRLAAAASESLARAQSQVHNATSAVAAANITATRSTAALGSAQRAHAAAVAAGNAALIASTRETLRLATAQEAEATTALQAARAQATHASSLGFVSRGAGATGLSLLGVRGATLAANAAFLAGAAAVVTFAKSVQLAASLEQELNVFRVTARATADEMQRVRDQSIALGRDIRLPGVSAGGAAEAMTELARAGLSVEDSLAGARGVLQLAAAAQLSNAEATQLAASALNAFGLAGDEAVHVADLLANAANEAQGGIADMGLALRQSAAVARQVGLSIEDTVTLLTLLARNGLQGSDAGTALRTSLIRLINPTKEANRLIRDLGINLRDAQGNIRPEVFSDFAEATADLSRKQQDATAAIIFGQDAIRAASILGREGQQAFDDLSLSIERQGTAAELAGARAAGFSGSLRALQSNLETFGTQLGQVVIPVLTEFVANLNEMVNAASLGVDGIIGLTSELRTFGGVLTEAIPGADRFVGALGEIARIQILGPVSVIARGVNRLSDTFTTSADEIRGKARETERDIEGLFQRFREDPGPSALNELVLQLDEMADRLAQGDAQAQRLAQGIRGIIREVQNFGASAPFREGFTLPPINVGEFLGELDDAGEKGANIVLESLRATMADRGRAIGLGLMADLGKGIEEGATKLSFETVPLSVERVTARFEESIIDAQIADDRQRQLELLRREDALIQEQIDAGVVRREKRLDLKRRQEQIRGEIESIEADIASDAKQHADRVQRQRREADQAFLDSLGAREGRLQNRALIAEATLTLRDDIAANEALRAFYRRSIQEARQTIKDAQDRANTISQLTRDLIQVNQQIKRDRAEQRRLLKEEREDRIQQRTEALELNIEFAQITSNRRAEIRAREALIRQLEDQIRDTKKGTNKFRELRNEIARQKQAIKDLRAEEEDRGRSFRELTFEFLQTQQGFAANLLSNLLPGGAAAGTVTATAAPAVPIRRPEQAVGAAAAAAAGAGAGVTPGQFAVLIDLTRQMLDVLRGVTRGGEHPEARHQRSVGAASMDVL